MGKGQSAGGGPGTHTDRGVRGTMEAPFKQTSKGTQKTMAPPFDHGRTGGDNHAMPEEIYADMGGPSKGATANARDSLGTIKTDPKSSRR